MSAVTTIVREAKSIRRKHPNKYKSKRKPWQDGYMKEATARYNHGKLGKRRSPKKTKPAKKRHTKRRVGTSSGNVKVYDQEGTRVYVAGTRRPKRRKRTAHHTVKRSGSRRVGATGGMKSMVPVLVGVGLLGLAYLIFKKPTAPQLPGPGATAASLVATGNASRDTQAQNILAYAQAANLTATAIANIIKQLNQSSDTDVNQTVNTLATMTPEQQQAWLAWYSGD